MWLFWAAVYTASVVVFLAAPDWAIGLFWLVVLPVAIALTYVLFRRLPRRTGVVPVQRRLWYLSSLLVAVAAFATAPISPLGPALAVAFAIAAFGWMWPRRLALGVALGLSATATVLVLLLDDREAAAAIALVYAIVFTAYGLFERRRLRAMR